MKGKKTSALLLLITGLLVLSFCSTGFAQKSRVGTATANFLEIGMGSAGSAMGDAFVSLATDLSAIYWNPAGLGYMEQSEAQFTIQPWVVDINTTFSGVGIVLPTVGTIALGAAPSMGSGWSRTYCNLTVRSREAKRFRR